MYRFTEEIPCELGLWCGVGKKMCIIYTDQVFGLYDGSWRLVGHCVYVNDLA